MICSLLGRGFYIIVIKQLFHLFSHIVLIRPKQVRANESRIFCGNPQNRENTLTLQNVFDLPG